MPHRTYIIESWANTPFGKSRLGGEYSWDRRSSWTKNRFMAHMLHAWMHPWVLRLHQRDYVAATVCRHLVVAHISMSHGIYITESWHTCQCVMAPISTSHSTNINVSWHTCHWVMALWHTYECSYDVTKPWLLYMRDITHSCVTVQHGTRQITCSYVCPTPEPCSGPPIMWPHSYLCMTSLVRAWQYDMTHVKSYIGMSVPLLSPVLGLPSCDHTPICVWHHWFVRDGTTWLMSHHM